MSTERPDGVPPELPTAPIWIALVASVIFAALLVHSVTRAFDPAPPDPPPALETRTGGRDAIADGQVPEPICLTEEATYACCIPERHIRPDGPYDCADYLYLSEGDLDAFAEACMSMDFWGQSMTIVYVTETRTDCLHWDFRAIVDDR